MKTSYSIKLAQDDVLSDEDDGLLKVKVKTAAEKVRIWFQIFL